MARARAHIPEEPSEARPASSTSQRLGTSALRSWLSTMIPAINPQHAAIAADDPQSAHQAGAAEIPTADRPVFPNAPLSDQEVRSALAPDHDLELLCDRLDTLTHQLTRLVTRMDADRPAAASAAKAGDPVEAAIAEIFERQRALAVAEPDSPTMFPPAAGVPTGDPAADASQTPPPAGGASDLSGLEQQLKLITKQLEILRSPCRAEELVVELRQELAGIAKTLEVLVPRSAFDALEQEVHALSDRLDSTRDAGADIASFTKLEQGLAEIRDAISKLAPIELGEAVQTLSRKVDQISGAGVDPLTLQQLDAATNSLRSIVTQVASGDALAALVTEVRTLGEKIDRSAPGSEVVPASLDHDLLLALEREVSGIAATLNAKADQVPAPAIEPLIESIVHKLDRFDLLADNETVFAPIKAQIGELGDKIDRMQSPQADPAVLAPLETQLGRLAEKIEHLQPPQADPAAFAPLEAQLGQLTDTIERMNAEGAEQAVLAALDERIRAIAEKLDRLELNAPERADTGPLEQRIAELADKLVASEARLGNLEAIEHGMTELIARLDEIRKAAGVDTPPAAQPPVSDGAVAPHGGERLEPAAPACEPEHQASTPEPQSSEPEAARRSSLDDFFGGRIAGGETHAPAGRDPDHPPADQWQRSSPPVEPVREPKPADVAMPVDSEPAEAAAPSLAEPRAESLYLPPDAPIEPGSGPPRFRPSRSAADRIAASQAVLGPVPADRTAGAGARPNFIIAARRAAQAASEQYAQAVADAEANEGASGRMGKALVKRVKSLFVTSSVALLALGATGIMLSLSFSDLLSSDGGQPAKLASAPATTSVVSHRPAANTSVKSVMPAAAIAPGAALAARDATAAVDKTIPVAPAGPEGKRHTERLTALASADTTGSLGPQRTARSHPVPPARPVEAGKGNPWSDLLPPALKTKPLAAGVEARDPGAAYEIALRYAEGRGIDPDMAAAATWFARAAEGGIVPAQFRLGGMYEKGVGVNKDLVQARQYYQVAAEHGSAHAMHNLAVIYAEGADGQPDFASAVKWFRKAAEYGVADSQYNAAVLLARGIGVEQNLGEAYKWFAVAAKGGDKDAVKKRDEIGERLDAQTLAAARLAASVFVPTLQPEEATTVRAPATGWDDVAVTPPKPRSRVRQHGARSARL